ncbi:unnamed protein product [Prorocentrum cordatum]|uniref:RNA-directed RNA polymerase n=1 Tax=Prorocentrum cordatum TaxID=2364126 RepID=A0ABN9VTU5_9DINO|nr:unnamed protein product [Polarella glacialis]
MFKEAQDLWKSVPFMKWEVIRELLVMLSEFDFKWVPPPAQGLLETLFKAWGTSLANELGFRDLRARAKQAENHIFAPATSWFTLAESDLMDRFGRPHTRPRDCPKSEASPLPTNIHDGVAGQPSVPRERLTAIQQSKGWTSFSGLSKNYIPAAWNLLLRASESDSWGHLVTAWHALLANPGGVVMPKGAANGSLVLRRSRFGFFGWPCKCTKLTTRFRAELRLGMEDKPSWQTLTDYKLWVSLSLHVMPPVVSLLSGGPSKVQLGGADEAPLHVRCAKLGFAGFPNGYLNRLMKGFGDPVSRQLPKTPIEKVLWVIKQILPKASSEDIASYLENRKEQVGPQSLAKDHADLLDALVGPSEKKDYADERKRATEQAERKEAFDESFRGGSKFLESLGGKAPPVVKVAKLTGSKAGVKLAINWDKIKALAPLRKKLLPDVKGCRLDYIEKRKQWVAFYPGAVPGSHHKTVGKFSSTLCMKACLRWAWRQRKSKTKEACPRDFS